MCVCLCMDDVKIVCIHSFVHIYVVLNQLVTFHPVPIDFTGRAKQLSLHAPITFTRECL